MRLGDINDLRHYVAQLFERGEIDLFLGYQEGTLPFRAAPLFVERLEEAEQLIWDATCQNNLAVYLREYRDRNVGVLVKGCDARSVVGLLQERQLSRERLHVVGVPCSGVIDPRKVAERLGCSVEEIREGHLEGDGLWVDGENLALEGVVYEMCLDCAMRNPVIYDVLLGDPLAETPPSFDHVLEIQSLSTDARWAWFTHEVAKCNLCYACRNACPLCYCTTCFVESSHPRWLDASVTPENVQFFQIMRTFHLAGRCVGCGACTRACPQGVDLRRLLDKLRLDVQELFGYEAGLDPELSPPLTTYREDDDNSFIMDR